MMENRDKLISCIRRAKSEIDRIEKRNGGPVSATVDKQVAMLGVELGRLSENMLKAAATFEDREEDENYSNYYAGIRNQVHKVAARSLMLAEYMDRQFDENGNPRG